MSPRTRLVQAIPSAILVQSAVTSRDIAGSTTTATKSKEIMITVAGSYLIKFAIKSSTNSHKGQIYRNGTALGMEQINNANAYFIEFSETVGGWTRGDLCQIFAWTNSGTSAGAVAHFRIFGSYNNNSDAPIPAGRVITDANV